MASINERNGLLFFDFRYKGQRCREYTKLDDTLAHRKRMQKVLERIEAEITLGTFVYRNYFPASKKAGFFDELNSKQQAMDGIKAEEESDLAPTFAEFTVSALKSAPLQNDYSA